MKILSYGEIMWDIYPNENCIGGAQLNFAAHVAKCNEEAYLLSCVGNDNLGMFALKEIKKLNINDKYIKVIDNKETGQCIVSLDENKVPTFTILEDKSYDYLFIDEPIENFQAIAFGSLPLRSKNNIDLLVKLIQSNKFNVVYCDLNLRYPYYNESIVDFCLKSSNIVKLSEIELEYVAINLLKENEKEYEKILKVLISKYNNIDVILLTCGGDGSYSYVKKENKLYYCPSIKVKVVSTVGAGDSYGATFLVNYLKNNDILYCMEKATKRSSEVISSLKSI